MVFLLICFCFCLVSGEIVLVLLISCGVIKIWYLLIVFWLWKVFNSWLFFFIKMLVNFWCFNFLSVICIFLVLFWNFWWIILILVVVSLLFCVGEVDECVSNSIGVLCVVWVSWFFVESEVCVFMIICVVIFVLFGFVVSNGLLVSVVFDLMMIVFMWFFNWCIIVWLVEFEIYWLLLVVEVILLFRVIVYLVIV